VNRNADKQSLWQLLEKRPSGDASRLFCIANQKGGVGKTTFAVNLGAALALRGARILVVDLDPQANATTGVGLDKGAVDGSSYELLLGDADLGDVAVATKLEGLWCCPGSVDLAGAEIELVSLESRERRLAEALTGSREFDAVLIDCPPSLGLLTLNALVAAQDLVAPVQCEYYALEGLGRLLDTAERVRRAFNPDLRLTGLVLTMYDARTRLSEQVAADVKTHFDELVFRTVIPRSVRLSEAPSFGEPVVTLAASSRGSIAFKVLASEVAGRYGIDIASAEEPSAGGEGKERPSRGPQGRGFGTKTAEPPGLDEAWPRPLPWTATDRDAAAEELSGARQ
jgi:chromosome partitioning protein